MSGFMMIPTLSWWKEQKMPIKKEELFTAVDHPAMYIVTTNATITQSGKLVMGRGAARELRDKIKGIDREAAQTLIDKVGPLAQVLTPNFIYGYTSVRPPRKDEDGENKYGIGLFQVKYHFKDAADIALIVNSMKQLRGLCQLFNGDMALLHVNFRMNYPGIGNGGLERDYVEQFIHPIPDNLTICYR